jgi:alpha-tubulin suppressor-like RCC1 family protein
MNGIVESRSNPVSGEGYASGGRKGLLVLGLLAVVLALLVALSSSSVRPAAAAAAGTVEAWGSNSDGQLGNGSTGGSSDTPGQVSSLTDVKDVAAGGRHSLALKNDGTVWAWGANYYGQLGNGSTGGSSDTPGQVSNLTDVKAIAISGPHSLALKNDGTVWAWGYNYYGQLGDGNSGIDPATNADFVSNTPVQASGLTDVKAIAAGEGFSLALKNDGTVWAWGNNFFGQLGDGNSGIDPATNDAVISDTPVQVKGEKGVGFLTNVKAIAAGGGHSLALKNGGTMRAWGKNFFGQLGDKSKTDRKLPVRVTTPSGRPLRNVSVMAAGANHSLALKTNGTMRAWGFNGEGQLGNGKKTNSNLPVTVRTSSGSAFSGVEAIAGGELHSLVLKTSGTVQAWGNNSNGELGDGNAPTDRTTPVPVSGLTNVEAIARGANARHGLAVVGP